jgi:hypothetical protein
MSYSRRELYALGEPLGNSATQLKVDGGRIYGGGGDGDGGSPAPTTTTTNTSNLPEYAQPYFENLLNRTQALSYQQYQPYGGARLAGFTPQQQAIQSEVGGMRTPGQFGQATSGMTATGGLGMGAAATGLGQALSYNPASAQTFGGAQAQQYMSPYQQNVTDIALREARQQGDLQRQAGMLGSIGRGTFGGARQALLQSEGDRNLVRTMGDIQAQGSQQAFQNAQQQFNADQQRQQQASQYAAGLGSQLFGAGLTGAQQAASGLGALGTAQQQADLNRINAQQATAAQQQSLNQNQLDIAYQDFLRQRDYPQEQLGFYSNILRGLPVQLASTQQTYQAAPNVASQIAGAGLGALSLGKLLGSS